MTVKSVTVPGYAQQTPGLPLHCVVIYATTLNACEVVDSCEVLGKHGCVTESAVEVLPV